MKTSKATLSVCGIGNVLLSDEGVGVHVLNDLRRRYVFPDNVELIDGGTMGLDLLPFIEGKAKVLFIDAANFNSEPGTIKELKNDEIPSFFSSKLSVHQIGLPDMLAASKIMGNLPEEMCLIGIQPKKIETGYGLSNEIKEKIDELISRIISRLLYWGVKVRSQRIDLRRQMT